jgi:FdhD protein
MVIKAVRMGIPWFRVRLHRLGCRSGGETGRLDLGRARAGWRFIALSGQERIVYDQNLASKKRSARHKPGEDRDG